MTEPERIDGRIRDLAELCTMLESAHVTRLLNVVDAALDQRLAQ